MGEGGYSRRDFLATGIAIGALIPAEQLIPQGILHPIESANEKQVSSTISTLLNVNFRELVSHADLDYQAPVTRSEAGQPVGNGRTGTLVWTTPNTLRFQVNRVDVHAENHDTVSFPERNLDYGSGCGFIDVQFGDYGDDVFSGVGFNQHLSVYDGAVALQGDKVSSRVFVCPHQDILVVEVEDQRLHPAPINIDLRMLRFGARYIAGKNYTLSENQSSEIITRNHSATSTLHIHDGNIVLTQVFQEGNFYNASAIVVKVVGRAAKAAYANDSTVRLGVGPERGKFQILIASASTFNSAEDVTQKAIAELDKVAGQSYDSLLAANAEWWHSFWSKAFVKIGGADGSGGIIEKNYTYYLYVMAACSRGAYLPRYGGMLWYTNGDMRQWGDQHWWHNESCHYNALPVANRPELMRPFLSMYSRIYERCAVAARQQWGSKGIFIPETTWFDGLEELPEEIAAEMRELYLINKPWEQRSEHFRYYAEPKIPHNSRWNWKDMGKWVDGHYVWHDRGSGPFGPVTHILSSGAKIAHLYWQHYEHTQNEPFLRNQAYPIIKGVAEFYCNFPNLKLDSDGKYHIHNVNNHEPVLGAQDTHEEMSAIQGILPVAIKAASILQLDSDLRLQWAHLLANLAPLPTNASPGSPRVRKPGDAEVWISGLPPVVRGDLSILGAVPAVFYDLCCVETEDESIKRIASATFEGLFPKGIDANTPVPELEYNVVAAANLGRREDVRHLLLGQVLRGPAERDFCDWPGSGPPAVLPNRMTLREGPGAISIERLGRMAEALHASLLQSGPAKPGGDPVLHVFPAWPKDWDADFTLSARGGFQVTSSWRHERVEFVELKSSAGRKCQLRNPWGAATVALYRNGEIAERLTGALLKFATNRLETVIVAPEGIAPDRLRRSV